MNGGKARRTVARIGILGISQLHLRNPYVSAWWSAALPGFGHILLSKYVQGFVLVVWELVVNTHAHLNEAIMYSFTGHFEKAKSALDLRWLLLYAPVFLFAVFDSYRATVDLNAQYVLAERERAGFACFISGSVEINFLTKKTPVVALLWSFLAPGIGQLYVQRMLSAFLILGFWILICYHSKVLPAIHFTFLGEFAAATRVLNAQWFLFIPSMYFFAGFDAYINAVENNKLYDKEQTLFLQNNYQAGAATERMLANMGRPSE